VNGLQKKLVILGEKSFFKDKENEQVLDEIFKYMGRIFVYSLQVWNLPPKWERQRLFGNSKPYKNISIQTLPMVQHKRKTDSGKEPTWLTRFIWANSRPLWDTYKTKRRKHQPQRKVFLGMDLASFSENIERSEIVRDWTETSNFLKNSINKFSY